MFNIAATNEAGGCRYRPGKFQKFYAKLCILGHICAIIGKILDGTLPIVFPKQIIGGGQWYVPSSRFRRIMLVILRQISRWEMWWLIRSSTTLTSSWVRFIVDLGHVIHVIISMHAVHSMVLF